MNYYMPVRLFTGKGCINANKGELASLGKRCMLVTGGSSAKKCGALDDVTSALESLGISYVIFDGVKSNPLVSVCAEAGRKAAEYGAEFIIGIGGGSPLDAAKATSVFAANPELDEDGFYAKNWVNSPMPIVLVGTTAGTGSEVTDVSVLTDSKHRKHSIHDPRLFARVSFGDPAYTMTLPREITLSTGIDVLAHCLESCFSKKATDISRAHAIRGIDLMYAPLIYAADGIELTFDDRERLYNASILGGLAISTTGTCFPHNMGYYLTEKYGIPHGFACALFLGQLLDYAAEACPGYCARLLATLNLDAGRLKQLISSCLKSVNVTLSLEEIEEILPRWENNGSVKNTVGNVTLDEVRGFLEAFVPEKKNSTAK